MSMTLFLKILFCIFYFKIISIDFLSQHVLFTVSTVSFCILLWSKSNFSLTKNMQWKKGVPLSPLTNLGFSHLINSILFVAIPFDQSVFCRRKVFNPRTRNLFPSGKRGILWYLPPIEESLVFYHWNFELKSVDFRILKYVLVCSKIAWNIAISYKI